MRRALIGYTGFVGSTLARDATFTDFFNSSNIQTICGMEFDEIVCAGVPAVKWVANKEPHQDITNIQRLLSWLETCETEKFTLISTIDVYPDPSQASNELTPINASENHSYGKHRFMVEDVVRKGFPDHLIVRLPALFGTGLKKNIIFDLLNGNQTEKINPASSFQWYNLSRLTGDIQKARDLGLKLVNLFPEPLQTAEIIDQLFASATVAEATEPAPRYDVRTIHSAIFGGPHGYLCSAQEVMSDLRSFISATMIKS